MRCVMCDVSCVMAGCRSNDDQQEHLLDVSLVVVLLLHEAALPGDEVLDVLTELEHLHTAALRHLASSKTGRGLAEVEDSFTENSVLYQNGLDTFLKYTEVKFNSKLRDICCGIGV